MMPQGPKDYFDFGLADPARADTPLSLMSRPIYVSTFLPCIAILLYHSAFLVSKITRRDPSSAPDRKNE